MVRGGFKTIDRFVFLGGERELVEFDVESPLPGLGTYNTLNFYVGKFVNYIRNIFRV